MSATRTVVPTGTRVEGRVQCAGDLLVEGTCVGDLQVDGELMVAVDGVCEAQVRAGSARVFGQVLGNLTCGHSIVVASGARVVGDVRAPDVSVDDGAEIDGTIDLLAPAPEAHDTVRTPVRLRGPSLARPHPPTPSTSRTIRT